MLCLLSSLTRTFTILNQFNVVFVTLCLQILATLVVAVSVASTVCGHPAAQPEDKLEETTTVKSGVLGWIKNVHEKIRGPPRGGCNHTHEDGHRGGPWNWVKNKLGFRKTATTAVPPTTTATAVSEVDYDGGDRRPDVVGSNEGGGRPATGDGERTETGDDERTETETGDGASGPGAGDETPETGNRDEPTSDAENGRPETESRDKSVGEDVAGAGSADTANGFTGEDLTPQSTSSSEDIDPRTDMNVK